jgi:hypothetical protein
MEATWHTVVMGIEITPDTLAPPAADYAHAVLSESPSRWLHTSGVVPIAPDGSTPEEIGEQATVEINVDVLSAAVAALGRNKPNDEPARRPSERDVPPTEEMNAVEQDDVGPMPEADQP